LTKNQKKKQENKSKKLGKKLGRKIKKIKVETTVKTKVKTPGLLIRYSPISAMALYKENVILFLSPCTCGGKFTFDAPPRCPKCGSTA